jgi:hypothetical protein
MVMPAIADTQPRTDADLVTAMDVSASIGRHEEWLQKTGLARALVDPDFVAAATSGPHGRIGFSVFAWSEAQRARVVVPWTEIASADDAARVSRQILATTLVDRSDYGGGDLDAVREPRPQPGRTDLSAAIDYGAGLLDSAPGGAARGVINVLTDGVDNVGGPASEARDRAVARGHTINAVALDLNPALAEHLRAEVVGGRGAFVLAVSAPERVAEFFRRKLLLDLLAYSYQ